MAEQDFLSSVLGEGVELTPSQKVNIDLSDSFDAIPYNNIVDYVVLDRWSLANPNNPNEVIKIDPTGLEAMRRDGMTNDEILMRFANFRDKNAAQRFIEEGTKAFATAFPATALGIRTGRQLGGATPAGILGGTATGFSVGLATDLLRSQMFPSTNIPYLPNSYDLEIRLQSEDRAHRIGQEKSVTYVDLVSPDTIDEVILRALRNKINLASTVLGEDPKEWLR